MKICDYNISGKKSWFIYIIIFDSSNYIYIYIYIIENISPMAWWVYHTTLWQSEKEMWFFYGVVIRTVWNNIYMTKYKLIY